MELFIPAILMFLAIMYLVREIVKMKAAHQDRIDQLDKEIREIREETKSLPQ